jgi:hypothetical protein
MRLHALVFIILTCGAPAFACPDQHDECVLQNPFGDCIQPVCVPDSVTSVLGKEQSIAYETPTVVPTYVGPDAAFTPTVHYDRLADSSVPNGMLPNGPSARNVASLDKADVFSDVAVAYYVKAADRNRISDALKKDSIPYTKHYYARKENERELSNALIYGPDTPAQAIKKVALALIDAGVDVKYIGLNNTYKPKQIVILNLMSKKYTVNYPNITRDQVMALSEFPSELKNGLIAFDSFRKPATDWAQVTVSELDTRMKYWETRLPFCTFAGGPSIPGQGSGRRYSL